MIAVFENCKCEIFHLYVNVELLFKICYKMFNSEKVKKFLTFLILWYLNDYIVERSQGIFFIIFLKTLKFENIQYLKYITFNPMTSFFILSPTKKTYTQ